LQVIILAGGFGTRLQEVVKDVPKPMAMINNKPFLEYLFLYLSRYNIKDVILSVSYKKDIIINHFKNKYKNINIIYSIEKTPLGTGGAIMQAFSYVDSNKALVVNGDTFFNLNLDLFIKNNTKKNFDIILSLKEMENFDRYGSVKVNKDEVIAFEEKKFYNKAYINCGTYLIDKRIFNNMKDINTFSFESFLETNLSTLNVYSYISNNSYFIDIGIPSDYEKVKIEFKEEF